MEGAGIGAIKFKVPLFFIQFSLMIMKVLAVKLVTV